MDRGRRLRRHAPRSFGPGYYGGPTSEERAGTYTVHVRIPGYAPWSRSGVRVREDACHVRTEEVVAELEPLPR